MKKLKYSALALAIASSSSFAGGMGEVMPEKLLFIEGGVAYTHAFYKSSIRPVESYTTFTPNGVAMDPKDFYPQDFFGGYIGASIYMSDWLMNTRYDMYGSKSKHNQAASTRISLAPAKLSFTLDKVWGDIHSMSYGLGGGAVIETSNDGDSYVNIAANNPASESIQGRSRIDPLVEGFLMYRFANNFGVKFNAAYQIPVNNKFGQGDLNLNLGINYAFPI